jgi:uncharacterized protein (TIGR04540 family)
VSEIIRNPRSIKALADELIEVCDGYWSRELTEERAKEFIIYWSKYEAKKLFKGKELNSTITKIIGKRRVELINKWLEGTQITL